MRKLIPYIHELLDIEEQGTEFCFRKLKFITIYNAYSNKSPFKFYISILGGMGGLRPCLFAYFRGGGPELGKTCLYNTCTLPNNARKILMERSKAKGAGKILLYQKHQQLCQVVETYRAFVSYIGLHKQEDWYSHDLFDPEGLVLDVGRIQMFTEN